MVKFDKSSLDIAIDDMRHFDGKDKQITERLYRLIDKKNSKIFDEEVMRSIQRVYAVWHMLYGKTQAQLLIKRDKEFYNPSN